MSSLSSLSAIVSVLNLDDWMKTNNFLGLIKPSKNGIPIFNQYGFYGVKLYFNGEFWLIEIDD